MKLWINFSESRSDFLNFGSDTIEKHKPLQIYASVISSGSKVAFLRGGGYSLLSISPFSLYTTLNHRRSMWSNFLVFHISRGISSTPEAFFSFFTTTPSSFSVNCPSLIFCRLLIISSLGLSVISVTAIIIFLKITNTIVRSHDSDTDFFDIVSGV